MANRTMREESIMKLKRRLGGYFEMMGRYDWSSIAPGHETALKLDCHLARLFLGASVEQYIAMEFWRKSWRERRTYLLNQENRRLNRLVRQEVTAEDMESSENKALFNRKFAKYIRRESLLTSEAAPGQIGDFVRRHGKVILKPLRKMQGKGIRIVSAEELDEAALEQLSRDEFLLEELIRQHPLIASANPSSVNTVRIATVLDKAGETHLIGAGLRCGGKDSVVDNFHSGGVIYPIDPERGIIVDKGKNNSTKDAYICHPSTGQLMLGMHIPHWEQAVQTVLEAHKMLPTLRYLGWDVAILEDGVELVEVNYGHDVSVVQYDHIGKRALVNRYFF